MTIKTVYYNHISVRDHVISAKNASKCDFEFGGLKYVKGLHIDAQWTANCSDVCTKGWCEIHVYIYIQGSFIPQSVNLYYVKKDQKAYVSFLQEVLKNLTNSEIIDAGKLVVETNVPKVLPDVLL